jgi:hypothetical protein
MRAPTIVLATLSMPLAAGTAAAAPTDVALPVGDWAAGLADVAGFAVLALAVWALRMLPAPLYRLVMMIRAEQLVARAVDYGVQAVAGAARGRTLTVDVGNRVLAAAARYAVDAADDVVAWLGGEDAVRRKILARLDLEAAAEAAEDNEGRLVGVAPRRGG